MKKFCLVTLLGLILVFSSVLGNEKSDENSSKNLEIPYFIDGRVIDIRNGSELTVLSEGGCVSRCIINSYIPFY